MSATPDKEMTVKEVAGFCGVHQNTVWNWIHSGKINAHRISEKEGRGVEWRIFASDVVQVMIKKGLK